MSEGWFLTGWYFRGEQENNKIKPKNYINPWIFNYCTEYT